VNGNNKGGIDFAVPPTAILDRLLQQNRHAFTLNGGAAITAATGE
jgi:hypothetical protein